MRNKELVDIFYEKMEIRPSDIGSDHYIWNPTMTEKDGSVDVFFRLLSHDYEGPIGESQIVHTRFPLDKIMRKKEELSINLEPILKEKEFGMEDPRVMRSDKEYLLFYTKSYYKRQCDDGKLSAAGPPVHNWGCLAILDEDLEIKSNGMIKGRDFYISNWIVPIRRSGKRVLALARKEQVEDPWPTVLLKIDIEKRRVEEIVKKIDLHKEGDEHHLTIGSTSSLNRDTLVLWGARMKGFKIKVGFSLLDENYDLKRSTPYLLHHDEESKYRKQKWTGTIYPCGMILSEENVITSSGVCEEKGVFHKLSLEDILEKMEPIR